MSLFEILGEGDDPGDIGSVRARLPEAEGGSVGAVVRRALLAVAIVAVAGTLAVRAARGTDATLLPLGLLVGYLVVSALVSPEPDGDNLGMAGGLVDHPMRMSDDLNRGLLYLAVLVAPGRWVVGALIEGVQLARGKRVVVQREVVFPERGAGRRAARATRDRGGTRETGETRETRERGKRPR
jgi:hypothetical protein